jgi:excisionase family DNA binding protein
MTNYMTTAEAAAYTRRHPDTIREAARLGELRSAQRAPRGPRQYKPEWLDDWLAGVRPRRMHLVRTR